MKYNCRLAPKCPQFAEEGHGYTRRLFFVGEDAHPNERQAVSKANHVQKP